MRSETETGIRAAYAAWQEAKLVLLADTGAGTDPEDLPMRCYVEGYLSGRTAAIVKQFEDDKNPFVIKDVQTQLANLPDTTS